MKATVRHERALRELDEARQILVAIDDSVSDDTPEDGPEPEIEIAPYEPDEARPLVRTHIRPDEFRWAVGPDMLPASTLRHWMSGSRLPFPSGDRRNLFELDAVWTDPDRPRKRFIRVDRLDASRFHTDAWERILELCRRPEPKLPSRHKARREQPVAGE
jgi:hypothetical protein